MEPRGGSYQVDTAAAATTNSNASASVQFADSQIDQNALAIDASAGSGMLSSDDDQQHLELECDLHRCATAPNLVEFFSYTDQVQQHQHALSGGGSQDTDFDGLSYGSLAGCSSISSDSAESDQSEASLESMVRNITISLVAQATSAQMPDLRGPNLVPFGDMHHLREAERKCSHRNKNGLKCTAHCCGDMPATAKTDAEGVDGDDSGSGDSVASSGGKASNKVSLCCL